VAEWYHWQGTELVLNVLVQPNGIKDQIVGVHAGALKIKVTAPALQNKANQHLCRFIAKVCRVSKTKVRLESGHHQRNKRIRIQLNETRLPPDLTNY